MMTLNEAVKKIRWMRKQSKELKRDGTVLRSRYILLVSLKIC
mgnify:CR=1 FL=1